MGIMILTLVVMNVKVFICPECLSVCLSAVESQMNNLFWIQTFDIQFIVLHMDVMH